MNEEEPPDLTVRVYKTIIPPWQYFPVEISNNGTTNKGLKDFSNHRHIIGTYKMKPKRFNELYSLCNSLFREKEGIVKKRIEELLAQN